MKISKYYRGGQAMNKKSTGLLLSILGVLSLILITTGVTYAFFSYAKEGTTENTISTGTITFYYDELEQTGSSISITDALPMSDDDGKTKLTATGEYFDFKVTSTVSGNANIPYIVTVRKDLDASTLSNDDIKIYLTASETGQTVAGTNYTLKSDNSTVKLYSELAAPSSDQVTLPQGVDERVIFTGVVPNGSNYSSDFQLRMWLKGETGGQADYSPYEFVLKSAVTGSTALNADDLINAGSFITSTAYYALDDQTRANYERIAYVNDTTRTFYSVSQASVSGFSAGDGYEASEQFYSLNGQAFKIKVNVYANAKVVTQAKNQ